MVGIYPQIDPIPPHGSTGAISTAQAMVLQPHCATFGGQCRFTCSTGEDHLGDNFARDLEDALLGRAAKKRKPNEGSPAEPNGFIEVSSSAALSTALS